VNGWDDHSHILTRECRFAGDGLRLICPMADAMN
jgi:hypothetical protein